MTWLVGALLALLVTACALNMQLLSLDGAIAAFFIGWIIFSVGQIPFSVPILAFFILSSLLSKIGGTQKMAVQRVFQKSSRRDAGQVLANGAVPLLLLLYWQRSPNSFGFYFYLAAIASATADTWATEIGVLSKSPPRLILNLRETPSGTSGAVSLLGLVSALLGAFAVSAVGLVVAAAFSLVPFRWWYLLVLTAAGFLAQILDSLLGASLQGLYRCANCNRISEKKMHCQGHQANHISGWKWVNNDIVNVTSNAFGVLLCWIGVEVLL